MLYELQREVKKIIQKVYLDGEKLLSRCRQGGFKIYDQPRFG